MKKINSTTSAKFLDMASACIVVAALYLAQDVLIPVALAALLSFLLTPVVVWIEKLKLGRSVAVVVAMIATCAILFAAGTVATQQIGDLASNAAEYQKNLQDRVHSVMDSSSGWRSAILRVTKKFKRELSDRRPNTKTTGPTPGQGEEAANHAVTPPPIPGQSEDSALWTRVVEPTPSPLTILADAAMPLVGPFGTAGLVLVISIFMLIYSEDIRDRIIRLAGEDNLHLTTKAIDEASQRVSKYLSVQLLINALYGLPIGLGLFFLGVPNAVLWGILAAVLRFIPYIGAWIAAGFPILLSLTVSTTWSLPLEVISLYIVIELVSGNLIEPYLYGKHTGVSALAVILSAVFWTWLWGPVGLLLSTPLTVCVVVISRYIPSLQYIYVLFGDGEALLPYLRIYQRLLANDLKEARNVVLALKSSSSSINVVEQNVIPVLHLAKRDSLSGRIDGETLQIVQEGIRAIALDLLPEDSAISEASKLGEGRVQILCVSARDEADEIASGFLESFLLSKGYGCHATSSRALVSEVLSQVESVGAQIVVISAVPPKATGQISYLTKKIWQHYPDIEIFVMLWNSSPDEEEDIFRRLPEIDGRHSASKLSDALDEIRQIAEEIVVPTMALPS